MRVAVLLVIFAQSCIVLIPTSRGPFHGRTISKDKPMLSSQSGFTIYTSFVLIINVFFTLTLFYRVLLLYFRIFRSKLFKNVWWDELNWIFSPVESFFEKHSRATRRKKRFNWAKKTFKSTIKVFLNNFNIKPTRQIMAEKESLLSLPHSFLCIPFSLSARGPASQPGTRNLYEEMNRSRQKWLWELFFGHKNIGIQECVHSFDVHLTTNR